MHDLIVLSSEELVLKGVCRNNSALLTWGDLNPSQTLAYEIERYAWNNGYEAIGTVANDGRTGNEGAFSFRDNYPQRGNNRYRIKAMAKPGQVNYSGIVTVAANGAGLQSIYLTGSPQNSRGATLIVNSARDSRADVFLYSISGQRLWHQNVRLGAGMNLVPATSAQVGGVQVILILIDGRVAYSQKVMF